MKEQDSGKVTKKRRLPEVLKPHMWPKGVSGNPKGRPKARYSVEDVRKLVGKDIEAIIEAGRHKALQGHFEWGRYIVDKVWPGAPKEAPLPPITIADSLLEQGQEVIAAAAGGELSASELTAWFKSLTAYAQLVETEELKVRIEQIEGKLGIEE